MGSPGYVKGSVSSNAILYSPLGKKNFKGTVIETQDKLETK